VSNFKKVQDYLVQLNLVADQVDTAEELVIINDPDSGLVNLIIDCEDPILVIEQLILTLDTPGPDAFRTLLKLNRELLHGAYCLDETGRKVIYRDTLQLETLDLNELEASIDSLRLALAEHAGTLLDLVKGNAR